MGVLKKESGHAVQDISYAVMTYDDGAVVNLGVSYALPEKYPALGHAARVEVLGAEGVMILDDDAPVGMPLAEYMGDAVMEISIIPNIARDANIPLFRFGFPVMDRVNLHRSPIIGYQGVINMVTTICNKFIDITDDTCDERHFEMMR